MIPGWLYKVSGEGGGESTDSWVQAWRQLSADPEQTLRRIYIVQVDVSSGGKDSCDCWFFHLVLDRSPGDWSTSQAVSIFFSLFP